MQDHPHASRLPVASDLKRPTLFPGPDVYHDLVTRPDHITNFAGWTESDDPALTVHVVSFKNATLLTLSWSHAFFDALGQQSLLKAWTAVLKGREEDVPEFEPLGKDPVHEIAKEGDPKKHVLYKYVLTGFWFMCFVASYVYELVIHSAEAGRHVCCPGPWVEELRQQAITEAAAKDKGETDIFLSHGDVLLAWWAKVTFAAQNLSPNQPINITNMTNCRGLFPDHLAGVDDNTAYIGNAIISTNSFVTCGELARMSVGDLALRVRQDLQQQRTTEQASHAIAWQLESKQQTGRKPLLGAWNQLMFSWSNWHRARFFDMDFSAAVERTGTPLESRANKLGRPSFILPAGHVNGFSLRNAGPLIGKDANGDWWLQWVLRANAWEQVEKHLESL